MKNIIFDLDGTLIDSKLDLANALNQTLQNFDIKPLSHNKIYSLVGSGVRRLIEDALKFRDKLKLFDSVFDFFLNYYYDHLLDNTRLYDGIKDVLDALKGKGKRLFVVSNKSEIFSRKILKGLNVEHYFDEIVGGDTFPNKKPHPQQILEILKKYDAKNSESIVIGDSENDIEAAKAANVTVCWVSYGFRDRSILDIYTVDFVAEKPQDILKFVL